MLILACVIAPFIIAFVAPCVQRPLGRAAGWLLAAPPLAIFLYLLAHAPAIARGETFYFALPWMPSLGVDFSVYLDGLALAFALLISGIGALIVAYAGDYLGRDANRGRFLLALFLFMGSMLGVVLAGNLITLFVFWELTSVSSYLLIGYEHHRDKARKAALQALLVTGIGGLALLAGVVLVGVAAGTYDIPTLLASGDAVRDHALYLPALVLVLLGAFTKSAQFPFHFWLPNAMEAPTPASAYLHSSTMVKAGLYLVARMHPAMGGETAWFYLVTVAGALTMFVAAWRALLETKLKRQLAYTTVAALGAIMLGLGVGTPLAIKAAMLFLFVHAFYKAALFMVAGAVSHETGEYDTEKLGGLARRMPLTAAAAGLAGLSMAGLPPWIGFIGKEVYYEAALAIPVFTLLFVAVAVFANMANFFVALTVAWRPFWAEHRPTPKSPHEAPAGLWLGPLTLGAVGLAAGLFPGWLGAFGVQSAAAAVLGHPTEVKLSLWHGVNLPLALSVLTVAGGLGLYAIRRRWRGAMTAVSVLDGLGPEAWYDRSVAGMLSFANFQTRVVQNGYLRYYVLVAVCAIVGMPGIVLVLRGGLPTINAFPEIQLFELGICAVIVVAAIYVAVAESRMAAVAGVGMVGYGIALVYVLYGAPDLAMTQFLIETLTVLLFVLVLHRMPRFSHFTSRGERMRDLGVAILVGAFMAAMTLIALEVEIAPSISEYYATRSAPEAHGRNIVNVILVDFRALDTLGEITVLAAAALGAYGLLRQRKTERGGS